MVYRLLTKNKIKLIKTCNAIGSTLISNTSPLYAAMITIIYTNSITRLVK